MPSFVQFTKRTSTDLPSMYGSKMAIEAASYIMLKHRIPTTTEVFTRRQSGITKKVKQETVYTLRMLYGKLSPAPAINDPRNNINLSSRRVGSRCHGVRRRR